MIEATQSVKKQANPPEPVSKGLSRTEQEERESAGPAAGSSEPQTAERQKQVTPSSPGFDVRLDGATMRLYSELRDPETDRVIVRLPTGYKPSEEGSGSASLSTEA